ncbi:molybdate transport system ATP-binding protein [Salegentibacter holothuriorum]|uniref:Molybdate transport system ATP-binding protein n=1 Tax=Salegentibacter holothuriorum TaxID=241145 RepID=A0A1T5EMV3_9FLAO|nr:ATP-binding cassette domain-containing protein [Salegentibacter holothuriorum]SKB85030.1 molybdate transport system ATP-binding protein [Salegentibacter holothuriorum]
MKIKHYGIFGTDFSVKGQWIQQLLIGNAPVELQELQGKKGLLFSRVVLNKFIEEDAKHGNSVLVLDENRSLRTFSSGEKRKALLNYLLDQKPDFLVLDNAFDSLDGTSVKALLSTLERVSAETSIIQLFKRQEDLLPFIGLILNIENEEITNLMSVFEFREAREQIPFSTITTIPPAPDVLSKISEVLVKMNEVSVWYEEKPILTDITWEIRKGDFWQLIGPNGSGKTTLLSMIYGDNPKAYGVDLYLFGSRKGSGESVWEIKKKIGYFSPSLTELFTRRNTVLEMLISGLQDSIGLYQRPRDKEVRLAKAWLEVLEMESFSKAIFTDLSELQQRIILIGRAMIKHPALLILDEPTTSLDDKSALEITSLIKLIARESETAIIFVSHRKEKGLEPKMVYQLIPTENGSKGEILPV